MSQVRPTKPGGQNWKTFLRNHAAEVWACDCLQVPDLFFRSLFAFFIIELKSRKVIHVNVTRSPTDPWVAQQLREATPYGEKPRYLIRDQALSELIEDKQRLRSMMFFPQFRLES